MPYYTKDDDEVDDFNEYDPTPYSGGYDITVTYGREIPPSDETCYPLSSRSGDAFEYQRPVFSSNHDESSAYSDHALKTEYSSYTRPKIRPGGAGDTHGRIEYGRKPESEHGSAYGGRTEIEYGRRHESEHGSGYGHRKDDDYKKESHGHKKHSGKDSDDDDAYNKKKDKKKDGYDSDDDHYKHHKSHRDYDDDEKKKKKDHYKHHKSHREDDD